LVVKVEWQLSSYGNGYDSSVLAVAAKKSILPISDQEQRMVPSQVDSHAHLQQETVSTCAAFTAAESRKIAHCQLLMQLHIRL
jgi:hypothetical protein